MEMKNWHDMKVAGTDKSIWDLKEADFNYRAPMDMTNISVNYDTKWLTNYWETGNVGDVFSKNVEQAHMRARQTISKWVYEKGKEDRVQKERPEGEHLGNHIASEKRQDPDHYQHDRQTGSV